MTTLICQHCEAENEAGKGLCVACSRPLAKDVTGDPAAGKEGEAPLDKDEIDRWLSQLPEWSKADAERLGSGDDSLPVWLQSVRAHADELTEEEADELLEFLTELEPAESQTPSEPPAEEVAVQAEVTAELPAWVAALAPEEQWPQTEEDEELSQHFAEAEESDPEQLPSTAQLPGTQPLDASVELEGIPDRLAGEELPEWLADQPAAQADLVTKDAPSWPARKARVRDAPPETTATDLTLPDTEVEPDAASPDALDGEPALAGQDDERAADATKQPPESSGTSDWPADLQATELENALHGILELPEADTSGERVDQWLDILEDLPAKDDQAQLEQLVLESELEGAEVPEWLRAMRPQESGDQVEISDLGPPEESGPLAGLRGIVPVAAISLSDGVDRTATKLEMSKGQRQQSALLRRLTMVEPQSAIAEESQDTDFFLTLRTILGLALLLVVLLGWLVPGAADLLPWDFEPTVPLAAEMTQDAIKANSGRTALVAFEYTPSMAGELDSVALALLADLAGGDSPVLTVSQFAAGVPMAERATAAVDNLESSALGFLPGEATGLRALGACLTQTCDSLAGREMSDELQAALADVNLIVVLSADRDSLANWLEQVGTQSDIVIVGGVTQALGPVARAYLASKQLSGLIEGMPVAVAYTGESATNGDAAAKHLTSLTLAQWLVIGALLAGAVYFGMMTPAASAVTQAAKK